MYNVYNTFSSVVSKCDKNLMNVSNLGVCFGPTLLRPEEETVASIMDLKFYNIVVEMLIENYDKLFFTEPESTRIPQINNVSNGPPKYGHLPPNNHLPTDANDIYGTNNRIYVNSQPVRVSPSYRQPPGYNQMPYTCVSNLISGIRNKFIRLIRFTDGVILHRTASTWKFVFGP